MTEMLHTDPDPKAPPQRLSLQADSVLVQDAISSEPIALSTRSHAPVALFANPFRGGRMEALIINQAERVMHLHRSDKGWEDKPIPNSNQLLVSEIVAVTDPDGKVWTFYAALAEGTLYYAAQTGDDAWDTVQTQLMGIRHLGVTYAIGLPDQTPVVYAWNEDGTIHVWQWQTGGTWLHGTGNLGTRILEATMHAHSDDDILGRVSCALFVRAPATTPQGVTPVVGYRATWEGERLVFSPPATTPYGADELVAGPPAQAMTLVLASQMLFLVLTSHNGNVAPGAVGLKCSQAVGTVDQYGLAHVYLVGLDGVVSVFHQTGWTSFDYYGKRYANATWQRALVEPAPGEPAVLQLIALALDRNVERLFADPHPDTTAILIQRKTSGELVLKTQDRATGVWFDEPVRGTSERPPVEVPTYRTQLTLVDAYGMPQAGKVLQVTAEAPTQVSVAGKLTVVGPRTPYEVRTDARGRATLTTLATGITTPGLIVTTAGLINGRLIRPDARVQRYLGGTGKLPLRPDFTGDTLKTAKAHGELLVPPSVWEHGNAGQKLEANDVVASIGQVVAAGAGEPIPPKLFADGTSRPIHGFVIQRFDAGRPAYRALLTAEDLEAERTLLRQHASYGGWMDQIGDYLGDVWEGVKRAGAALKSALVDLKNRTVELVMKIGDKLIEFGKLVIETVRDAADVVTAVFATIEAKAAAVVDWLSARFSFAETWNTATALGSGLAQLGPFLLAEQQRRRITADAIRAALQAQQQTILDKLCKFASDNANKTFQDLNDTNRPPSRDHAHDPEDVLFTAPNGASITRGDVDGALGNWFFDLIVPRLSAQPPWQTSPAIANLWQRFRTKFQTTDYSFGDTFTTRLEKLFRFDEPGAFGRLAVSALIGLVEDLVKAVFTFLGVLAEIFLELAAAAMGTLNDFLTTPIRLPLVETLVHWIYDQAHPGRIDREYPPVTVASVFGLICAFPITFAWRLAGATTELFPGGRFPVPGEQPPAVRGDLNPWPFIGGLAQIAYFFFDSFNDVVGYDGNTSYWVTAALALFFETVVLMMSFPNPNNTPFHFPDANDPAANARAFNWLAAFFIVAADLCSFFAKDDDSQKLMRQRDVEGKIGMCALGLTNLATGIWECVAVEGITPASIATNILTPLTVVAQPLRIPRKIPGTDLKAVPWWAMGTKIFINLFSDAGGGIARAISAGGA